MRKTFIVNVNLFERKIGEDIVVKILEKSKRVFQF